MTTTGPLVAPERVAEAQAAIARLVSALRLVILGKEQTIDEVVVALLARGHVLLEGLPGLGKTELVKALSRLLTLDVRRIQFTPDLLPTDVTGSHILQERDGHREFVFHPGPIFTNLLLADEINRASPKTQAALLEAMQERRVTTFGTTRPLPAPFFVLATQNPIELEGTYPLPEAQLDRFMFKVDVAGVERAVLEEILVTRVHGEPPALEPVLAASDLDDLFSLVDAVHLPRGVANYIARLVAASHPSCTDAPEAVRNFVRIRQFPPGGDFHRRGVPRPGPDAGETQRRLRRRAPRRVRGDGASTGAGLRGTARGMGRAEDRCGAAGRRSGDRARSAADARAEGNVNAACRSLQLRSATVLLICLITAAPAAAEYRTFETEGLRITIDSDWGLRAAPGYLPVRFDITNLGDARVIEIVGRTNRFVRSRRGYQSGGVDLRQTIRLARHDRVRFTMPVPIFGDHESINVEFVEDGRTLERFHSSGFQSRTPASDSSVLFVIEAGSAFENVAGGWPRSVGAPGATPAAVPPVPGPPLDFVLPPPRLPATWLGYTSLRAVLLGRTEWERLHDAQRSALLTWTAAGGDLIVVDGDLTMLFPSGLSLAPPTADNPVRGYFFGRIHLPSSAHASAAGLQTLLAAAEKAQDRNWALPVNSAGDWATMASRGFRLPIPDVHGVPARAYLAILLVFSLLIGPVNFWYFWRRRQQVLLVLTAPILSALFVLLLATYVLAGEGIGVRGRAVTFTILDQARKQASTRASVSLYAAGMAPTGGLRYPRDVAVFAIGPEGMAAASGWNWI